MTRLLRWLTAIPNYIMSKRWYIAIPMALAVVLLLLALGNWIANIWAFWDDDPDRGATIVQTDVYGDVARTIKFVDQNWTASQTLWFDGTTQGSDLLPYDFFLVLEQPNGKLVRDNENMNNHYRYLVRKPTFSNPDGLPVGFVKDTYQGKEFLGYTCAACHTAQINHNGVGIRIPGAPAMADMDTFLDDLGKALLNAQNPPTQARFVKNVLALGNYGSEQEVIADLKTYALRLYAYRVINKSPTKYGFARLDAFGRIYNQVLEYVLTVEDINDALEQLVFEGKLSGAEASAARKAAKLDERGQYSVLTAADRDSIIEALALTLKEKKFLRLRDKIFNRPSAPVSYPFLWDIPQHDYVQWNGIAANASLGPVGRNTGEVIGVFGTMNWTRSDHWTLAGVFSGQGLFNGHPMNYASSINVHNLTMIEDQLGDLWAPRWPQDLLGTIQEAHRARGEELFDRHCAACHATIDPRDPRRRVVTHMSALDHVKTDPAMAQNGAGYTGYSGIVRNEYVTVGPGPVLLDRKAAVAALLVKTTTGVVATPDADKGPIQRFVEWLGDIITALRHNDIDVSMKSGDYHPDTTAAPLSSVLAYKGRALDGIWATAPYLHNGSVPSLYDLLLPAKPEKDDPPGMEYRPAKFMVGSREFDTCKVGFNDVGPGGLAFTDPCHRGAKPVPYDGFLFLTEIPGNSNAGHEYGTRPVYKTDDKGNNILVTPALTLQDRLDLVEYLKSL